MRLHPTLFALVGIAATAIGTLAIAQESSPAASPSSASMERPARGLTMEKVEAKFGAPSQKLEPVGKPAITRWEYPGYVVYFEQQFVLHTVALK